MHYPRLGLFIIYVRGTDRWYICLCMFCHPAPQAEEKEKRLKELQKSEDGKDEANAIMWRDALKQAHGEKVLDNPKVRYWQGAI